MGKNSANNKLIIFFLFSQENRIQHSMQTVSSGGSLHEMSNFIFWEKEEKYFKMSSVEIFTQHAKW